MSSLFTKDKATYCCGPKAAVQRFSQKWERVSRVLSKRAETTAKKYIAEIYDFKQELPGINIYGNGGVELLWEPNIILYLDPDLPALDVLEINYKTHPVNIEKIKEYMV